MKEETKEILENVKKCCDITKEQSFTVYQRQDILKLLDYITNLQEELKGYKQERENLFKTTHDLQKEIKRLENKLSQSIKWSERRTMEMLDYKSRCEKAIDNIDTTIEIIKQQPTDDDTWILDRLNGFKYLLQGEGKDD